MVVFASSIRKVAMTTTLSVVTAMGLSSLAVAGAQTVPAPQQDDPSPRALAKSGASTFVKGNPSVLHASGHDSFAAGKVIRSGSTQYVPYERTHQGLPVVGGDFVVVTGLDGQVKTTSTALDAEITGVGTQPKVSSSSIVPTAQAQLTKATSHTDPELVVHALGDKPRLAWATTVTGTKKGAPSRQTVYVDATTGDFIAATEHVVAGEGTGAYNGPAPLALDTTESSDGGFELTDPAVSELTCQDAADETTFSGDDDEWGDGDPTNKETGCVDALYAVQTQNKMLDEWLGRDGMDGEGGFLPIRVGLEDMNAYYDGTQVQIGHNQADEWIASIDVLAHEFGHGIDDHTPGGISGNGTQEFIGDVFGALTEAYSAQSEEYDEPDYLVGEEIDLVGDGPIRNMYDPSQVSGDPNCYSDDIPDGEVHATAGPGNHWFYLLAEGNKPADGPESPTCNDADVSGIGIQEAGKIVYNAMLMKTSDSSYLKYRTWTLEAAKNLYPDSCTEFNAVKEAWDAVDVPAQDDEPSCEGGEDPTDPTDPPTDPEDPPAGEVDYSGIAALDNCSASVVRFDDSEETDQALGLTNGHCYEGGMPGAGEVIVDEPSDREFTLLDTEGNDAGSVNATQVLYATMTDTDVALYELDATYQELADEFDGFTPLTLATDAPADGTDIAVVSGYWQRIYTCSVDSTIPQLKEGDWTFTDSVKYTKPGCETIGGTSGSPVVDAETHEVVAANNTGNEDGEECTMNNPCEVDEDGEVTVDQGAAYAQQTSWFYTCLAEDNSLDLSKEGCLLPTG